MPTDASATHPVTRLATPAAAPALLHGWLLVLGLTLLWDLSGADLTVMQAIGGPHGFALRDQWLLSQVLHDALRQLLTGLYLLVWLWAAWPSAHPHGPATLWRLPRPERLRLALLVTLSLLVINLLKQASQTSCPWDLQSFGGPAHYVSHWTLGQNDGGTGHCFPGGHASSGFAFLPLSLPWLLPPAGQQRAKAPGWWWLGAALLTGLLAGSVQTLRGAHYPSHTLWTLVICGGVSLAGWHVAQRWRR